MRDLKRLLAPKSIAVVGGGLWCENVLRACQNIGFEGPVWPVHPGRAEMVGLAAFQSIDQLPEAPDATFVGVNRAATVDVVAALRAKGGGGAICFASGFAEAEAELADGRDLQAALLDAAGDMAVLGPNCYGILNLVDGAALWPDQHGAARVETGVAILAQSSNVAINLTMQRRSLPIAYIATVGNQAQTDMAEIGATLLDDARVTALGLYVEGIKDLRQFENLAAKARAVGKSIVALKVGASVQAQTAAISHTASLAGSAAGASALFDRLGIATVNDLGAFLETLKALHVMGPLSSNRIASMSCSGGEASLVADSALATDLVFPPLEAAQRTALAKALGPKVALANPLDYHTYIWGDVTALTACFTAMMKADLALGMVVLDFPRPDLCDIAEWRLVIDAVVKTHAATGTPMAIVSSLPDTMPEEIARECIAVGILPLAGLTDGLAALNAAVWLGRSVVTSEPLFLPAMDGPGTTLGEAEAKTVLADYGLPVPRSVKVRTPEAAAEAAETLGFPVVLKAEGLAHKTEAGGVALNLSSATDVLHAARDMAASSFLVEEMITDAVAELLVGVTVDAAHGFVLTLGAGGVLAEVLCDTQSLLLPSTDRDIRAALNRLRIAPVLKGYRGGPSGDVAALVAAVLAVQDYVTAHQADVLEVEVNPLIVTTDRAIAADALIRIKEIT